MTDPAVDIFDREAVFIETILKPIIDNNPNLKVVMEHITTRQAVEFVKMAGPNIAATITAHHLLYNRNSLFKGGICPHMYCLPILKREGAPHGSIGSGDFRKPQVLPGHGLGPARRR